MLIEGIRKKNCEWATEEERAVKDEEAFVWIFNLPFLATSNFHLFVI